MKNRAIIIIGGGGHARVLIGALQLLRREVLGYVDLNETGPPIGQIPHLGNETVIRRYKMNELELVNGVGSLGPGSVRHRLFEDYRGRGFRFAGVVHPAAVVAPEVRMGEGVQIMAGAVVQAGSRLGANCIINTGAVVDHDCRVGVGVHVASGAVLAGQVFVGTESLIGAGAVLIQSVRIGARTIIGAGAVVVRNVAGGVTAVGVPAKPRAKQSDREKAIQKI